MLGSRWLSPPSSHLATAGRARGRCVVPSQLLHPRPAHGALCYIINCTFWQGHALLHSSSPPSNSASKPWIPAAVLLLWPCYATAFVAVSIAACTAIATATATATATAVSLAAPTTF
jgi:hypothetical protein